MLYLNEIDPFAAAWLRELFPEATVDARPIQEVRGSDLVGVRRAHFFAGIGGWDLSLALAGVPDDLEVWTGSCPCQPFSSAGVGRGEEDERHLWPEFRRLIAESLPAVVFGEQVASRAGRRWLAGVRADLEGLGYRVGAADLCAAGVGAPHIRQRLYWGAVRVGDAIRDDLGRVCRGAPGAQAAGGGGGVEHGDNCVVPGSAGADGGLADTEGERLDGRHCASGSDGRAGAQDDRAPRGLGHADDAGPQGRSERGDGPGQRASHAASVAVPWTRSVRILCSDGKWRSVPATAEGQIEPGLFPLAPRLPRDVGRRGDPCRPVDAEEANASQEFRVARLRGYGNAIVPDLAAVFVREFFAASEETR